MSRKTKTQPDRNAPVRDASMDRKSGAGAFPLTSAFQCAWSGVAYTFRTQRNLKIQALFAVAAVIMGIAFSIDQAQWLAIIICIMVVASCEVLNTAVESTVDLASPIYHDLARIAKDASAGAVLVSSLGSLVVAAVIFVPPILQMFGA